MEVKRFLLWLIYFYRNSLKIFFGPCCRFYPSCSVYAEEAIKTKGALQGSLLSIKRICKCHPLHPGGIDLVPGEK